MKINNVKCVNVGGLVLKSARPLNKPSGRTSNQNKGVIYVDDFITFDIETSRIPEREQSFMYIAMCYVQKQVVLMRNWDEVKTLFSLLSEWAGDCRLICFVHNLSYEFQFLSGYYEFDKIFIMDSRKVAKCNWNNIEFRCSYIQTNKSLKLLTKDVKHAKQDGDEYNYDVMRYPWSELSKKELGYCVNDVVGLYEAMHKRLSDYNDTLYTIPLTSTGYVRRLVKSALQPLQYAIKNAQPDEELYTLLREAFRGGDTHANRYYANRIVNNVISMDLSSAYPYQMISQKFPYRFNTVVINNINSFFNSGKACIARLKLANLQLKDSHWPSPYLSRSKCRNIVNCTVDNGRILSADELEITVTEIDYKIICHDYIFDIVEYSNTYQSNKGPLPKQLTQLVKQLFADKTTLKGIPGREIEYMKSKNLLNSLYGLSVTETLRHEWSYDHESGEFQDLESQDYDKAVQRAFMLYQWGVYVTAYQRELLHQAIEYAYCGSSDGIDRFVYSDTDSVKFICNRAICEKFVEYNSGVTDSFTAYDKYGTPHTMGIFEYDGFYYEFKTLGAKKYAYRDDSGLHITIAGVTKNKGAQELFKAGGLRAMREGYTFRKGGGVTVHYNDDLYYPPYVVDGKVIPITRNVCLAPGEYTIGLTADYVRLIQCSQIYGDLFGIN